MKLSYTTSNGKIVAEFDADTQRDMFSQIANFQEVFEENTCGKCGSQDLRYIVRTVNDDEYFELRCNGKQKDGKDCRAKFSFGLNKKGGGMFPKRKDGDTWLPNGGWVRWNNTTQTNE
jgi:hypothetical protein